MKLLYFTAPWCGPCKYQRPVIEKFIAVRPSVSLVKHDVDKAEGIERWRIQSIPTLIFTDAEEKTVFARGAGLSNANELEGLYQLALKNAAAPSAAPAPVKPKVKRGPKAVLKRAAKRLKATEKK